MLFIASASLATYADVSQDERRIEVFRRADGWVGEEGAASATVRVHGALIEVDRVYG